MVDPEGKVVNFSRYWPIPEVSVADRDYFQAMKSDPKLKTFVSAPVVNRSTGTWTIYLAHRLNGPHGELSGLIVGAMILQYYEDFYKAILPGEGSAISLVRTDGTLLARYPHIDQAIGRTFGDG